MKDDRAAGVHLTRAAGLDFDHLARLNRVTETIIGAAISVHRELGPGLLESTYEKCLTFELAGRGIAFERQKLLPINDRGVQIDAGYRIDLVVERTVIVEIKSIAHLERIHTAQVLTYLRLSGCPLGLLINFNVRLLKDGVRRIILDAPRRAFPTSRAAGKHRYSTNQPENR